MQATIRSNWQPLSWPVGSHALGLWASTANAGVVYTKPLFGDAVTARYRGHVIAESEDPAEVVVEAYQYLKALTRLKGL